MKISGTVSSKVLILVESAGVDPWKKIEDEAQKKFLRTLFGPSTNLVWINGRSDGDGDHSFHPGVRGLRRQLKLTGSTSGLFLRKALRAYVSIFQPQAFGVRKAREFFYGRFRGVETEVSDSRVTMPYPIQIHIAGIRAIETFRHALNHFEFDYLVRISSTCLVRPEPLFEFIAGLPSKRVFAGRPTSFGFSVFMSGSATVFSRDVVEGIVHHERDLILSTYEDVALSLLIRSKKLADFHELRVSNVLQPSDLPNDIQDWEGIPIVRCKAEAATHSSELVMSNMKAVMKFLLTGRAEPPQGPSP